MTSHFEEKADLKYGAERERGRKRESEMKEERIKSPTHAHDPTYKITSDRCVCVCVRVYVVCVCVCVCVWRWLFSVCVCGEGREYEAMLLYVRIDYVLEYFRNDSIILN